MKKILVISGKGGTGKTTVSSSIIKYFNVRAFADCDVDAPNLHLLQKFTQKPERTDFMGGKKAIIDENMCVGCGICNLHCRFDAIKMVEDIYSIIDYACEGCGVCCHLCPESAIHMVDDVAGKKDLYIEDATFSTAELKMGRGNSGKLVMEVKDNLYKNCDSEISVLDGSPGTGCPVMASLSGVDIALIVTEPTLSGISDLQRIHKTVALSNVKCSVCINKSDINRNIATKIENWCKDTDTDFAGTIPYDPSAPYAINQGKCVIDVDCPASESIKKICKHLEKLLKEI